MPDPCEDVRGWLAAFNARSEADLLALAHPDIVFRPLRWVRKGEYRGHEGVRAWLADLVASPGAGRVQVGDVREAVPGQVVAEGTIEGDGTPFTGVFTFRDGQLAEIRTYLSDRELLEQLGVLPAQE